MLRSVGLFSVVLYLIAACTAFSDVHQPGEDVELVLTLVDGATGEPISGESPTVSLFRHADGYWWNWQVGAWQSSQTAETSETMIEIETTGRYSQLWQTSGQDVGAYAALMDNSGDNAGADTVSVYLARSGASLGTGTVPVNHDYPVADAMTILDENLAPVDDAYIKIYSKTNYDAGRLGQEYIVASTMTNVDGHWEEYCWLDPATYIVVVTKSGLQTQTPQLVVSAP